MKILVTFASIGGNTMMVAQKIADILKENNHEVELIDMFELEPQQLVEYPIVFIGSSTWGDGEYNDFSQIFFDKLTQQDLDLSGTQFAIFGLGETFYPFFCGAVEHMQHDLRSKQALFIGEPIKIDGYPDESIMEIVNQWMSHILPLL